MVRDKNVDQPITYLGGIVLCAAGELGMSELTVAAVALSSAFSSGVSAVLLKYSTRKISPLTANFLRSLSGALILGLIVTALGEGVALPSLKALALIVYVSFTGPLLAWYLYAKSLSLGDVTLVHPVVNTYPFVAILVGSAFLGSSVSVLDLAGGVLIVVGLREVVKSSENSKPGSVSLKVLALSGAVAFLWGINTVVLKYLTSLSDPLILALYRSGLAATFMLPLVLARKRTLNSLRHAAAALGAGFTSDTLGVILFLLSLQLGELATASILTSTSPLFSAFLSQVFLKEKPPENRWLGIALIVAGIALVSA